MSNIQLVENLYRLRKAHHYTQQEISDLLNISRQAYSNYETSKRTPDLDSLMRLADIYGVSLDQLVNHPCTKDGLILEQKGPFTRDCQSLYSTQMVRRRRYLFFFLS